MGTIKPRSFYIYTRNGDKEIGHEVFYTAFRTCNVPFRFSGRTLGIRCH